MRELRIVGVALSGREGSPVVVFEDAESGDFLPLPTNPFDAEIVIREFTGEGEDTAVSWLAETVGRNAPRKAAVETDSQGRPSVRFSFGGIKPPSDRLLPLGEGLGFCRRLDLGISADPAFFEIFRHELEYLEAERAFRGNFLYLTPPQYAPTIPFE